MRRRRGSEENSEGSSVIEIHSQGITIYDLIGYEPVNTPGIRYLERNSNMLKYSGFK